SQVAASVREAIAQAVDLTTGDAAPRDILGNPNDDEVKRLRVKLVNAAQARIDELIYEYFDISSSEQILVEDTNAIIIRSTRPSKASDRIPTLKASTPPKRREYTDLLCGSLNDWAKGGPFRVQARVETSPKSGIGVVVLERHLVGSRPDNDRQAEQTTELAPLLEHLQEVCKRKLGSVETLRGLKVFDGNRLYLVKPLNQRFWTKTAALNDADDIA